MKGCKGSLVKSVTPAIIAENLHQTVAATIPKPDQASLSQASYETAPR